MRTHTMHIRPEGLFYCTLLERLSQKHARYDEVRQRALYYTNGFAREQDVLSIMEHHPRRMSVANVIVYDGTEALRMDHLLIFETYTLILDVSYVDEPIMALEDGTLIRLSDMQTIGNPLHDVKRKAKAFKRLANEQGWAIPPIRSEVLFVHAEDIVGESGPLPAGYTGPLDMAEELVAAVRLRRDSADRDSHAKTVAAILTFILKSPADPASDSLWRDPAYADTVDTLLVGPRSEYDSFEDLRDTLLDILIVRGDVMTEEEAECFIGAYSLTPDEEREVRQLFGCMRHSGIGDYTLSASLALSIHLMSRLESYSASIAERIYDDVTV